MENKAPVFVEIADSEERLEAQRVKTIGQEIERSREAAKVGASIVLCSTLLAALASRAANARYPRPVFDVVQTSILSSFSGSAIHET